MCWDKDYNNHCRLFFNYLGIVTPVRFGPTKLLTYRLFLLTFRRSYVPIKNTVGALSFCLKDTLRGN